MKRTLIVLLFNLIIAIPVTPQGIVHVAMRRPETLKMVRQ
jgi:hypothetical protein